MPDPASHRHKANGTGSRGKGKMGRREVVK